MFSCEMLETVAVCDFPKIYFYTYRCMHHVRFTFIIFHDVDPTCVLYYLILVYHGANVGLCQITFLKCNGAMLIRPYVNYSNSCLCNVSSYTFICSLYLELVFSFIKIVIALFYTLYPAFIFRTGIFLR